MTVDNSHTTQSNTQAGTGEISQSLRDRIASLSPAQQQLFRQQLEAKGIPWNRATHQAAPVAKSPIAKPPIPRPDKLPLSASQQHLWVLHQLYPYTTAYHIALVLTIEGELKPAALRQSLQSIVDRHESLRTVFLQADNRPYAKVLSKVEFRLPVTDLSQKTDPAAEAERDHQKIAQKPFDLESGPLIRAELLKCANDKFELVLGLHHLIADGWSRGILLKELALNYRSQLQGESAQLPKLTVQYPDYVLQQQQWLKSEDCQRQKAYWKQQLAALPELNLLTDGLPGTDFTSQTCTQVFSRTQTEAIKAIATQSGATVFMVLLAAFKLLLYRYSGQTDIAVGVPAAGRNSLAVEPLIGFFVNTLVLRSRLNSQAHFPDWLKQIQANLADALQHQDIPFSEVVDAVGAARVPGKNPLFRVMFQVQSGGYQLQNAEQLDLGMPGLTLSQQWIGPNETKFDMSWHVIERDGKLLVAVEYRTALFEGDRIERMLGHFHTLVDAIAADPSQGISRYSLLSAVEKERVLTDWSQGKPVEGSTLCFPARFEQQVEKTPEAIALCDYAKHPNSQTSLTYRQLNQRANKLAHWLSKEGIEPETLVGICLSPGIDLMVALLATLKAGGAYIPIDPALPAQRIRYMLKDAKPAVLISRHDRLASDLVKETSANVLYLEAEEQVAAQPDRNLALAAAPTNLAYVIYTSGSTGNPKGTQLTHGGLINYLNWCLEAYPIRKGCGAPVQSSIGFDATITSLFSPLLAGKQVVFGLGESEIEALQLALSKGFSLIKLTPAHLSALRPLLETQDIQRDLLPKALIIGGEALEEHHIDFWREQYPEVALFNEYGPTEAVVGCCVHQVNAQDSGSIPIGRPINGVQLYILDESKQIVPAGVPGDLYVGGEGIARGYLNQLELTAERFVELDLGGRLYETGDRAAYQSDGTLQYFGRIDSQIKLRGFRMEPGEIEVVLCQHQQVEQAVVVLRADDDRRELVAYITTAMRSDIAPSKLVGELRQQLSEKLPGYMVPSHIVRLEALPLTINGKVDRDALPAPVRQAVANANTVQPRDRKEHILLGIWKQILNRQALSVHDNFFDLGGDSISGMQIVSEAREQGLKLTPAQLFEHQTIAEQAAIAQKISQKIAANTLSSTPPTGNTPLSPIQRNFFEKNLPDPHHYNQSVMLKVKPGVKVSAIQSALESVVQHHDTLRSHFRQTADGWQQYIAAEIASVPLSELDLTAQDEQALDRAMAQPFQRKIAELQASFNLTEGPLVKGALLTLKSGKYLLLTVHHLLIDGVSWRILLADLLAAYQQIIDEQPIALPDKTTAFGHWTSYLKQQSFESERPYWADACCATQPLPVDLPWETNTVADEKEIIVCLDAEKTALLKALSSPINIVLLTALTQTLKQWSQNSAVVLDIEGHGRQVWDDLNLSRSVGWFTALYPLRVSLPSGSLDEQLRQVEQQLKQVPNEGVGYGALRFLTETLPGQSPLISPAQISFNYLGQLALDTAGFITGLAAEPVQGTKSTKGDRSYLFEIVALIQSDQLQVRWRYSQHQYEQSTIQQLSQRFVSNLQSLIAHGNQPDRASVSAASFSAAQVEASQLDQLMGKLQARKKTKGDKL